MKKNIDNFRIYDTNFIKLISSTQFLRFLAQVQIRQNQIRINSNSVHFFLEV
jgi:hypothetical protein